jgi:hypothetical protein
MLDKIQLNNEPFQISERLLPCLVLYPEKTGGSHFSVSFIADLFLSGSKILFLTAYPMATDNFLKQTQGSQLTIIQAESEADLVGNEDAQAIMIKSGHEDLFLKITDFLDDIAERIIFVKNMEVFGESIIRKCLDFEKIVLSGNIDKCRLKDEILKKSYTTTVLFNQPQTKIPFTVPKLEKYTGYLWSKGIEGMAKLRIS